MKRFKKLLAVSLAAAVCVTFSFTLQLSVVSAEPSPVQIGSYSELSKFISDINSGALPADTDAELTADITVDASVGNDFVPLAKDEEHSYQGVFEGNGKTINGIDVYRTYPKDSGNDAKLHEFSAFVSFLGNEGVIQNLNVEANIHDINDVAGIVSQNYGTVSGCTFKGMLVSDQYPAGTEVGSGETGGIAAFSCGKIMNCEVLSGSEIRSAGNCAGGIAGFVKDGQIISCKNAASVEGLVQVGGVIGKLENKLDENGYTDAYNLVNLGNVTGVDSVGGIVGFCPGIVSCTVNYGTVTRIEDPTGEIYSSDVGGVAGYTEYAGIVADSLNVGKVIVEGLEPYEDSYAGGVIGTSNYDLTENCYYCIEISGDAKNAIGNSWATFSGAVTLKQMAGDEALTAMKNLFDTKDSFRPSVSWAVSAPVKIGDDTLVIPPQITDVPITTDEILASGAELTLKYKTDMSSADIQTEKVSYVYTGDYIKPDFEVFFIDMENPLNPENYTVHKYMNNIEVGYATIIVKGAGDYFGVAQTDFEIEPKQAAIKKLTAGKKKFKVTAKTPVSFTGGAKYRAAYRLKGLKKWKYKTFSKQSLVIDKLNGKKLKSGKTYEVKIRAFKEAGDTTFYGAWSTIKKVKVK